MQWYRTGTITVTNGSATVTGASTLWSDVGTLNPGDIFNAPDGKLYEILTINSNTGITLNSVYLGSSLSGQAYSIMPIGLLPSTLAQSVKSTLATAATALASTVRYDINTMGLTLVQQQNARTNIAALAALDVGQGRLSKSVAGGVDVVLTTVEASNQFIELTGTITANINVIVPAAPRLFFIVNLTTSAFTVTVKTPAGSGVICGVSTRMMLECDGANVTYGLNAVGPLLTVAKDGSNGVGAGAYYGLAAISTAKQVVMQLNAASGLSIWVYDGAAWTTPVIVSPAAMAVTGAFSCTSTLLAGDGTTSVNIVAKGLNSGTGAGSGVYAQTTGSVTTIAIGNASNLIGGAYDATPMLYSNGIFKVYVGGYGVAASIDTVGKICAFGSKFVGNVNTQITLTAVNAWVTLPNSSTASGVIAIRDDSAGGTDFWIIDPNQGAIRLGGNVTVTLGLQWSGGNWQVRATTGTFNRLISWVSLATA